MLKKLSLLVCVVAVSAASAGCSAGRSNPQSKVRTTQDSVGATLAGNAIRDAYFLAPVAQGQTAHATLFLARTQPGSDTLVAATSDVASAVSIRLDGKLVSDVAFDGDSASSVTLDLEDVSKELVPAASYPVTLRFADAGEVTLQVPVLRPGIVANGTSAPSSVPEIPVGSTVPLDQRSQAPATEHE